MSKLQKANAEIKRLNKELDQMFLKTQQPIMQQPMVGINGGGTVRFNGSAECYGAAVWAYQGKQYIQINGLIITILNQQKPLVPTIDAVLKEPR